MESLKPLMTSGFWWLDLAKDRWWKDKGSVLVHVAMWLIHGPGFLSTTWCSIIGGQGSWQVWCVLILLVLCSLDCFLSLLHVRCLSKDGEEDDSCIQAAPFGKNSHRIRGVLWWWWVCFPLPRHPRRKRADRSCDIGPPVRPKVARSTERRFHGAPKKRDGAPKSGVMVVTTVTKTYHLVQLCCWCQKASGEGHEPQLVFGKKFFPNDRCRVGSSWYTDEPKIQSWDVIRC